jgi:phage recombination protein Bet
MSTALTTLSKKLADRFGIGDGALEVLKATAFKGPATDDQMTALLIVANQYGLNPWTKEIYAFADSRTGIVPVVGVDGWSRIINEQPAFDGVEFVQDDQQCTCIMYRKDRAHPTKITEYMSECKRDNVAPWKSHPRRMLRHKALIQCARVAFGFGGIYDQDEAERIVESPNGSIEGQSRRVTEAPELPTMSPELEQAAKAHAEKGTAAYAAWFKSITKDERYAITPIHELNKARAAAVDAEFEAAIKGEEPAEQVPT